MVEKKKAEEAPLVQRYNKTAKQIKLEDFINHPLNKKIDTISRK